MFAKQPKCTHIRKTTETTRLSPVFVELSTAVQCALEALPSNHSENIGKSFGPIVLQRTIVDVEQFINKPQTSNYVDIWPNACQSAKGQSERQVDPLFLEHLHDLYQTVATCIKEEVPNPTERPMKVLWRNPTGIDRTVCQTLCSSRVRI